MTPQKNLSAVAVTWTNPMQTMNFNKKKGEPVKSLEQKLTWLKQVKWDLDHAHMTEVGSLNVELRRSTLL